MRLASTIAMTGNSGIYAVLDCGFNFSDRALWKEHELLCSGCLDAAPDVAAGSVERFKASADVSWPSCSTVTR